MGFTDRIRPSISAMVRSLTDRFYAGVSRYTTSGFLRIKVGEALEQRGGAAHIFESTAEAQSDWRNVEGAIPTTDARAQSWREQF